MKSPTFDIASQEYKRFPYPTLAKMIDAGPVVKITIPLFGSFWAATTYEAVNDLLRDREAFVRDPRTAGLKRGANLPWWFPRSLRAMAETMINRDEPDHRRLRGLVEQAFVRRNVEPLRPRFQSIATQMLDDLEATYRKTDQPVDLVAGLARPFPLAVICELLGLPQADRPMFVKHAESITSGSLIGLVKWFNGIQHLTKYIREQIQAAKKSPHDGLISALALAEQDGERLTEEEVESMVLLLLLAGHITTVHLISGGIYTLWEHSEQKRLLTDDLSQVFGAVNEMLRYLSPVQMTKPMMPVRDMEWRGQQLKRGDKIVAFLASANVDPSRFERPAMFEIRRQPNPHVAFGAGIHNCLGWKLAVAEAEVAIAELLTRFPKFDLGNSGAQARWSRQPGTRGLESLPSTLW